MAVASFAVFSLQSMAAKAHRHWDADIERIIAKQQAKKREADAPILVRGDSPSLAEETRPQIAAFTTRERADDDDVVAEVREETRAPKARSQGEKKNTRRAERKQQQHFIPSAFAALPKFATATTTTLLGLR